MLHGIGLVLLLSAQRWVPSGFGQVVSLLSFLLVAVFLVVDLRARAALLGAFLSPAAVAVLVPSLWMSAPGPELAASLRQPLLPVHIAVALAGLAVFGVATAVAGVYLAVERMLKGKRFGPFFRRVPSLELLDDLNRRLVAWGFIALSLTLLTGAWVQARLRPDARWGPAELAVVVAWMAFGVVLQLRMRRRLAWPPGGAAHHGRIRRPGGFVRQPVRAVGDPVSPPLVCVGLSHHTAPVDVRERLALPEERQTELLQAIAQAPAEALLISTCNRVELYVVGPGDDLQERTRAVVARAAGDDLVPYLYAHHGEAAVLHLFRVAASLDSMILGEPQILGQVKDAFEQAQRLGAARGELARVCAAAFGSAKRVRTETELGRAATSMASAAVEMARHIFDGLEGKTVLLIGAGEMAELSGKHLLSAGASRVLVANRTFERAEALAVSLGGQAVPFDRMEESLVLADVVVCTTASPAPVITREKVARVLKPRRHRPLFLVDLAVPRDVDPDVHTLDGVYAYDVDDIQKVIDENQAARAAAAARAEVVVAEEVARYIRQRAVREQVPVLAQLRARAEQIRRSELERAMAQPARPRSRRRRRRSSRR